MPVSSWHPDDPPRRAKTPLQRRWIAINLLLAVAFVALAAHVVADRFFAAQML